MQITSYTDLRTKVLTLIDGDNVGSQSIAQSTLDLLIGLGEQRVYRELRASTMLADLSATVTSNAAALPSDLIELKEVYFSGERPLEVIRLDELRALEAGASSTGNTTRYCAQDGDTLRFWPLASGTVLGRYYKRPTDLASETTWANATTLARYPELFLFAACAESAPFLGEDERIPMWEGLYKGWLQSAERTEAARVWSGSPLRVRPR